MTAANVLSTRRNGKELRRAEAQMMPRVAQGIHSRFRISLSWTERGGHLQAVSGAGIPILRLSPI